jgi:hypothetical protein
MPRDSPGKIALRVPSTLRTAGAKRKLACGSNSVCLTLPALLNAPAILLGGITGREGGLIIQDIITKAGQNQIRAQVF